MSAESQVIDRIREIAESCDDNGWQLVNGNAKATYTGGPRYRQSQWSTLRDRADGRYLPFFEDEHDLNRMRASARSTATICSALTGVREALRAYTIGGEWKREVKAAEGYEPPEGLVEAMNRVMQENMERNQWEGELDKQLHDESREEGEFMLGVYHAGGGLSDWRKIDCTGVKQPSQTDQLNQWTGSTARASWTFGVLTDWSPNHRRVDHTKHLGYYVTFNDTGNEWDFLPAWPQQNLGDGNGKCAHFMRRNVPAAVKRGLSDYLPIRVELEREAKLTENLSVGAAILAAIPWIEKLPEGTSATEASASLNNALNELQTATQRRNEGSGRRTLQPGQVPVVPAGREYIAGPMGAVRQPIWIDVSQHLMRRVGTRFLMPEYMVSGDASNANYASTLVSEAPFVKARQEDQRGYERYEKGLHWKSLRIAYDAGAFKRYNVTWAQIRQITELSIRAPEVASRDRTQLVGELSAAFDRGLLGGDEFRQLLDLEERPEFDDVKGGSQSGPQQPMQENCGTGKGGFKGGNSCSKGGGGTAPGKPGDVVETAGARGKVKVTLGELEGKRFNEADTEKGVIADYAHVYDVMGVDDFSYHDKDDGLLYHVTPSDNDDGISRKGLVAGKRSNFGGSYGGNVKGRVFFTGRAGVKFWANRIEENRFHNGDSTDLTVYVFEPEDIKGTIRTDVVGTADARETAYYVEEERGVKESRVAENCGTGDGGFKDGNTCARGDGSEYRLSRQGSRSRNRIADRLAAGQDLPRARQPRVIRDPDGTTRRDQNVITPAQFEQPKDEFGRDTYDPGKEETDDLAREHLEDLDAQIDSQKGVMDKLWDAESEASQRLSDAKRKGESTPEELQAMRDEVKKRRQRYREVRNYHHRLRKERSQFGHTVAQQEVGSVLGDAEPPEGLSPKQTYDFHKARAARAAEALDYYTTAQGDPLADSKVSAARIAHKESGNLAKQAYRNAFLDERAQTRLNLQPAKPGAFDDWYVPPGGPGKWTETTPGTIRTTFDVGERKFSANFTDSPIYEDDSLEAYEFSFADEEGSYRVTDRGDAMAAMRGAVHTLQGGIEELREPEAVFFTAAEKSRRSLYRAMTRRARKVFDNYRGVEYVDHEGDSAFALIHDRIEPPDDNENYTLRRVFESASLPSEDDGQDFLDDPAFWDELEELIRKDRNIELPEWPEEEPASESYDTVGNLTYGVSDRGRLRFTTLG